MSNIRYSEAHEWIILDGDAGTVGISEYAQSSLGDVVFVELPEAGADVKKDAEIAVIESVKAASEIYTPVSGVIIEVNETLEDGPEQVNTDALGKGWIFKIKLSDTAELDSLMTQEQYLAYVEGLD